MRKFNLLAVCGAALALASFSAPSMAEVGMGLRVGTLGYGIDFDVGMTEKLNLRLAYNAFDYDYDVEDTDVRYEGKIKISSFSALLDWHVAGGSFRLSAGAVGSGPEIEMVGTPSASNTYTIGNSTYTGAQIGSLRGKIEVGSSVAPYIGIGWGNVANPNRRVSFLFDLGLIYGGTPDVSISATCGSSLSSAQCTLLQTQLQNDLAVERQELEDDVSAIRWYPVLNIGVGFRF